MAYASSPTSEGGFIPSYMLSPPQSTTGSTSTFSAILPHPRSQPLRPGGTKESALIRFIDQGILRMERRYAKRGTEALDKHAAESSRGYESFAEVVKDMQRLFDLVWVSGTPALQVPYLLSLASMIVQCLPSFVPPSPRAMFRLLERFDVGFASLLVGAHVETGEALPGFEGGARVSGTEKVRMKGIVERTRVMVARVMASVDDGDGDGEGRITDVSDLGTSDEMDVDDKEEDEAMGNLDMSVAKVYDRTIVELGDTIGTTPIGIITDE